MTEEIAGGRRVRFLADLAATGANLRPAGEDLKAGDPILAKGERLGAAAVALLAAQGITRVPVQRRPRVAYLTTGDELVPAEAEPGPGRIRNSNAYLLHAQLEQAGYPALDLGTAPDAREPLRERLSAGLAAAEVLITCGGISAGRHDLVGETLVDLGAEWIFHRVRQQPGKPLALFRRDGRLVFALPGNPVSSFMTIWYYVLPALRRLEGETACEPFCAAARLGAPLAGRPAKTFFARARAVWNGEGFTAEPLPPHGSHILGNLPRANAFIILPPDTDQLPAGAAVRIGFCGRPAEGRTG
jgi:molybdopterin molybdotransferase